VEQSFYLQFGLDPVAAARENPLHIALLLGNGMRQQLQTVQRFPDKKSRYDILVLEGRQFCRDLLKTVGYPVIGKLKLTDDLILKFYQSGISGELKEWIGQNFRNETGQSLPPVLDLGQNTGRYDPRRMSGDERETSSLLVRFVESGSLSAPSPNSPDVNPEEAAVSKLAQQFAAAFKRDDLQTQASLATGSLVEAIRNATCELEARTPRFEIKVEDVDVQGTRAIAILGMTSDQNAAAPGKLYLVLRMNKMVEGWRIEKIQSALRPEDINDDW
jgi:hypothetical protein